MKQEKKTFIHESIEDRASIREILKAITQGVKKGKLNFSDSDGEVTLNPDGLLRLKVSATQSDEQNQLSIKVSWQNENRRIKKGGLKIK